MTKANPALAVPSSDPIVCVCAEMIISASRRTNLYVRRQLESGPVRQINGAGNPEPARFSVSTQPKSPTARDDTDGVGS